MRSKTLLNKTLSGLCAVALSALLPLSAQADHLADVQKAGVLRVGTEMQFAPFDYMDGGKQTGLNAALFKHIADELQVRVEFLDLPWPSVLPGLEAGKFDLVAGPLLVTKARMERYQFTLPIADGTVALLKQAKDQGLNKPEDIAGKIVGAGKGSAQLEELKAFAATLPETVTIREYVDTNQAYADLAAGRLTAVANSHPNIAFTASKRSMFKVVEPAFGKKSYFAYVARKGEHSESLIAAIDHVILEMHQDGRMAALQKE